MSESELIEDPQEITALYFPNEGGIQWQGETYLPADYVLSRGQEPVAYALYDPDIPDDDTPELTNWAEIAKTYVAEGWRVVPLYAAHPKALEPSAQVKSLIRDLTDPGECWFDHHGGCQEHGYLTLKAGEKCPHAEAKELLSKWESVENAEESA